MKISIDGLFIEAQPGQTVLELAREANIPIPTLCFHAKTGKAGRCRACLVEVEGQGLKESCALAAREGMAVHTDTPRVLAARRMVVELLLADGAHDCLSCQANGACELQDMAYQLGIERPSLRMDAERTPLDLSSKGIVRDADRCIQCGRCVSACQDGVVNEVLSFGYRANHTRVICDADVPMGESSCVSCGECVQVCPVGALTFRQPRDRKIRAWETRATTTTCPYCGVGCQIDLHVKDDRYAFAMAHEGRWEEQPNRGMLCVKGRFGLDFIDSPERLRQPLLRRDGELVPVSWDEALSYTAQRLQGVKDQHGADAIGFLASAKVTNEENYAFSRLARAAVGTNNIDHCARL